ncbi:MAG: hypothetical protein WC414_00230 [Patescibacteria group bacterium]
MSEKINEQERMEIEKDIFIKSLRFGLLDSALEVQKRVGDKIDWKKIPGYDKAVENCFLQNLKNLYTDKLLYIQNNLAEGKDLSTIENYKNIVFESIWNKMENESSFSEIMDFLETDLGKNIKIEDAPDYEKRMSKIFSLALERLDIKEVEKIKENFAKNLDLKIVIKDVFNFFMRRGEIKKALDIKKSFIAKDIDFTEDTKNNLDYLWNKK